MEDFERRYAKRLTDGDELDSMTVLLEKDDERVLAVKVSWQSLGSTLKPSSSRVLVFSPFTCLTDLKLGKLAIKAVLPHLQQSRLQEE